MALPTCCRSTTSCRWRRAAVTTLPTCVSFARSITDAGTRAAPATAPLQPRREGDLAEGRSRLPSRSVTQRDGRITGCKLSRSGAVRKRDRRVHHRDVCCSSPAVRRRTSEHRRYPTAGPIGLRSTPPARLMLAFPPPLRPLPAPAAHSPPVRRRTSERQRYPAAVAIGLRRTPPARLMPAFPPPLRTQPVQRRTHRRFGAEPASAGGTRPQGRSDSAARRRFGAEPTHAAGRERSFADRHRGAPRGACAADRGGHGSAAASTRNPHARGARGGTFRRRYGARCGGGTVEPAATRTRSPA